MIPRSKSGDKRADRRRRARDVVEMFTNTKSGFVCTDLSRGSFLSAGWEVWDVNVLPLRLPTAQCGGVNLGTPRLPQSFMTPPFASQQLTAVQLSHANRRQQTAAPKTLNQLRCHIYTETHFTYTGGIISTFYYQYDKAKYLLKVKLLTRQALE